MKDTKTARVGQTVFFKHKYLTQPAMTDTDALIQAADGLSGALQNAKPESDAMKTAVDALVKIFKGEANIKQTPTDQRRQMRAEAQRQRVATETSDSQPQRVDQSTQERAAQKVPDDADGSGPQRVPLDEDEAEDGAVLMPGLEVTYPSLKDPQAQPHVISQDWDGPSQNTRAARMQRLFAAMEMSNTECATSVSSPVLGGHGRSGVGRGNRRAAGIQTLNQETKDKRNMGPLFRK